MIILKITCFSYKILFSAALSFFVKYDRLWARGGYVMMEVDGALIPYQEILDNLDIAVVVFDAEGNYKFVNTTLVRWRNPPGVSF